MYSIVKDTLRLIRDWWQIDRLRVSPREGQLLRIFPGAIVGIGSQLFEVVSRTTGLGPVGPYVIYRCLCGDRTCQLSVELAGNDTVAAIRLSSAESSVQLTQDEIEIYGGQCLSPPPDAFQSSD